MAKTDKTLELEREIWQATHKQGVFCCYEVTIGWFGDERVDYLTYDTKGIWRCYEIKVSVSDFHSKAKNTFIGHFNYYVIPRELYEKVRDEIPSHVGVYVGGGCVKKAKRQVPKVDEQTLKDSLIRSLYREVVKVIRSDNPLIVARLEKHIDRAEKEAERYRRQYWDLMRIGQEKFGSRWHKEIDRG
mgnify:CR=1 FL=1